MRATRETTKKEASGVTHHSPTHRYRAPHRHKHHHGALLRAGVLSFRAPFDPLPGFLRWTHPRKRPAL